MSPLDPAASLMGRDWGIGSRSLPTRTIGAGVPRLAPCGTCTPSFALPRPPAATVADRTTTAPTMKDREAVPANAEEARRSERATARVAARVIMPPCFSNRRTTPQSPELADLHWIQASKTRTVNADRQGFDGDATRVRESVEQSWPTLGCRRDRRAGTSGSRWGTAWYRWAW